MTDYEISDGPRAPVADPILGITQAWRAKKATTKAHGVHYRLTPIDIPQYPTGETVTYSLGKAYFPGPATDIDPHVASLRGFVANPDDVIAMDTETSGLAIFNSSHVTRLFQIGTTDRVWILRGDWHADLIREICETVRVVYLHNGIDYDTVSLYTSLGVDWRMLLPKVIDTMLIGKVLDPRPTKKGGPGHSLGESCVHYLGIGEKADTLSALVAAGRQYGITKDDIYEKIPIGDPTYLAYSAADVFQGARLAKVMLAKIREDKHLPALCRREHDLAQKMLYPKMVGTLVDLEYAKAAKAEFEREAAEAERKLIEDYRIPPTASGRASSASMALKRRFTELGIKLTETTPAHDAAGCTCDDLTHRKLGVSELYLISLGDGEAAEIARLIQHAKLMAHYAEYQDRYLDNMAEDQCVHPSIVTLAAATGRMSIRNPALQQLPRDEPRLRGSLRARPGHVLWAIDYGQLEARVGAALAQDSLMIHEIVNGLDLHAVSAEALYGPCDGCEDCGGEPWSCKTHKQQRQRAKSVTFGRGFGGGPKGILTAMRNADPVGLPPYNKVAAAVQAHKDKYADYEAWCQKISKEAERRGGLRTVYGRPLKVDWGYQAIGYTIQSTSRDIFADAIFRLWDAGIGEHIRFVVHDEIVFEFPRQSCSELADLAVQCMETEFMGVPLVVDRGHASERWTK
jgi:DNA polymerase-1